MANANDPRGFRQVDFTGESQLQKSFVLNTNADPIFRGDPISQQLDGSVIRSAAGDGDSVIGIAQRFISNDIPGQLSQTQLYMPALTAGDILYVPVKNMIFTIQAAPGIILNSTDVGATADFVVGAGDTLTGRSGYTLGAAGAGNQVRILGLASNVISGFENKWGQENVLVRVAFVEDALSNSTSI